jgi:putative transposase
MQRCHQAAATARVILSGIEMVHMMRKQQAKYACNRQPSLSEQFDMLAP